MAPTITPKQDDRELTVLFVGTPPIDLQRACDKSVSRSVDLDIVTDGREAIKRLTDAGESPTESPKPDIILLQFGFSLPDGMTVLHAIKSSPRLKTVPVVVLKPDESGVEMTYGHGGNAHVTTPETSEAYADLIDSIGRFWFEWAQYPAESLSSDG